MADNSSSGNGPSLHKAASSSLAVQRLTWAMRPMGLLFLVLWALHPSTANHGDYVRLALLGFLAGTTYGLIIYGQKLRQYISFNTSSQKDKNNRVPEEYYWGNILQVMFDNGK